MKVWEFVERHHEEFGSALFVLPACIVGFVLYALVGLVSWLLG